MKIIYTNEKITNFTNTIFLAGPTPRNKNIPSWRKEALHYLEELNFNGTVIVPEYSNQSFISKEGNIFDMSWDHMALEKTTAILMWIPRNLKDMPAFTSNIEFGYFIKSQKLLYGRPDDAPYMEYLDWLYEYETKKRPLTNLKNLCEEALEFLNSVK